MESSLEHEDLLIKLRAKLNEGKIKLWDPPYISSDDQNTESFLELANAYAIDLSIDVNIIIDGLKELQQHSIERSKANEEYKETGCATLRVKTTGPGNKGVIRVVRKLTIMGSELMETVAEALGVESPRVKLIFNGKVIKSAPSLAEQGVNNGIQLMALIMAESPEQVKKEDNMYMEMKETLDDATLLSEYVDELADDEEYMRLEDQSGNTIELPRAEKRALSVGLAMHSRGRAAIKKHDYSLALVLLLEADRQLSECRSQILSSVDNWAVLQLDIAWCYLCLRSLQSANDAATRLTRAELAFRKTYGEEHERLIALKGTAENERVLFMRLYLLQGIVAYHQNKRQEARALLEKAERELNSLQVDETSVEAVMELGWSRGQACTGLRATNGDVNRAHHYLEEKKKERDAARKSSRDARESRALGVCMDGSTVSVDLVRSLQEMGFSRRLAVLALRNSNNNVTDAVRLINDHPDLLRDSDASDQDETSSSSESQVEADARLLEELKIMGYPVEQASAALRAANNDLNTTIEMLSSGDCSQPCQSSNPSTSESAEASRKRQKNEERIKKRKAREEALRRLRNAIRADDEDYLDTSLTDESHFLAQYKSLL
ncbi:NEDD8 ultimate buster 1-like [Leptidea sinapis]|uniref:NEDD8 ultimate buster 1-like n=1 Tax=Leptidea sinapis TaxID=189913 RepID=UPI0021274A53|nr:NEDD8 ultimate buster 1-like [Leptidea sinapis]